MATIAGVKIKTKVTKSRNPIFFDEKYTGGEPSWPEEASDWPEEQFDNRLRKSFYYYNYYYSQKDCKPYVVEWMKKTSDFDSNEIRAFEKSNDRWLPMTACSLIMAHRHGMPFRARHIEFLNKTILEVVERSRAEPQEEVKIASPEQVALRPTIQDRLAERTSELIGELEGYYDELDTSVKFYDWLVGNNVVQGQLTKYENLFQKRKAELTEAQSKSDAQLKEAYSHFKPVDFKRRHAWIDNLLSAIEQYRDVKKAAKKARVKKAPSKEKLVAKLKYAKDDKALKIVSINPADIIGASELWVYNTKTRKLGKYVAASYQTLSIKGTGVTGFDVEKSVGKTLRKPDEQLKDFAKAGKIALRTYLKDIKAVEVKLNGRISTDTLLLKVA
jgi:hypothetical protein